MPGKRMNPKDRIKKHVPGNEWFINVAKSAGFATAEIVKDLLPNTTDNITWNKTDINKMLGELRTGQSSRSAFAKQFKNLPAVKATNDLIQNMKDDLKSGKFYNMDRLESDDGFDFGDMFDDEGPIFFDDEEDYDTSGENINTPSITPNNVISTLPLAKAITHSAEGTISTMIDIADQQMNVESEKLMHSFKSTTAILNGMTAINDNLATLINFNTDSTAKFHAAGIEYYKESLELLKKASRVDEPEDEWKEYADPFTFKGNIKMSSYLDIIKKNLQDMKDESGLIGEALDMVSDPLYIKAMAMNPIHGLTNMFFQTIIPSAFKSAIGSLDKSVNSILPALLARINTYEDSDSPLLNMINKVFGYKPKIDYDVDLGVYEKGQIAWDGESKKALVDVIPSYLRRIESALTGDDERVFDYDEGKFKSKTKIKTEFEERLRDEENSGYFDYKSKMRDIFSKFDPTYEASEQFEEYMNEYFSKMTKRGSVISHEKRRNEKYGIDIDDFMDELMFDYNIPAMEVFKNVLREMDKTDLIQMASTGIKDSRINTQRLMDGYRKNATKTGLSSLFIDDESITDKAKFVPGEGGRLGSKDEFGLSQLDYLRDIRSALIHGIKVFPDVDYRYKGWRPNQELLKKEHYENSVKEERDKMESEFESFKPTWGTNSMEEIYDMSQAEWDNTLNKDSNKSKGKGKVIPIINKVNDKVEDLVYEILYGKDITLDDIKNNIGKGVDAVKGFAKGKSKGGAAAAGSSVGSKGLVSIISNINGFYRDTVNAFKSYFTGQPYTTSDGHTVEGDPNNLFNKMKSFMTGTFDKLGSGKKTGEEGLLSKFTNNFMEGFKEFKVSLFGEKGLSEREGKETMQDLMQTIKPRVPKAIASGFGAAMVKTMFASNLGLLGSFLLPGGPLGAALVGTTASFLKQSETFNRWMYGELDEDGNRMGGFISKDLQDKIAANKSNIKKSTTVGLLSSIVLGPVAGTLLGLTTGYLSKNEAFQEFLFGKDYKEKDKKSLMDGYFGRLFKKSAGEGSNSKLAAFLGAGGLGVGLAQGVGLLPSMLLPGGPIMGAILGLAGGITASSDKFQEFLLGEKDVDGKRYGGLLTKVTNWFDLTFAQPLKIKMTEINDKIYGFMRKKIFDPISRSFEPIAHAVKNVAIDMKNGIVDAFTKVTSPIVDAFKEEVIHPIKDAIKTAILNPIKRIMKTTFGLLGKGLLSILSSPLNLISGVGHLADMYNTRAEIRHEKRRRGKEYDKAHKEDGSWNAKDRKKSQKMTKQEKEELLNEKLSYRDGKTWRQRKKEQKGELKDEMTKRKERLAEMKQQFEEDKKFTKESGWKYSSKRQQEKREQELKEKDIWFQEQQLMKAQDTDEKVGKVSDSVVKMTNYQDKTNSKLDDIKETLKDGFDKLTGKFKDTIVDKNFNILDINKKLQDEGKSHADGLDNVPNDGYVAELHEGEMVVPKKPAGKLRQMMDKAGKGFSGLNEALSQTSEDEIDHKSEETTSGFKGLSSLMGGLTSMAGSMMGMFGKVLGITKDEKKDRADNALGLTEEEEDRMKEIEDKAKYEHASRKDVDFIQNKIAADKKEKEERKWKDNLLSAVRNVGSFAAAAAGSSLNLFDMLKDLGGNLLKALGSLAIPAALQTIMEGANQYQNSEEYIKGHTDVDTDGDGVPDMVTDNYDLVRARTNISARKILWEKPIKTIKNKFIDPAIDSGKKVYKGVTEAGKTIKTGVSKVGHKVYNSKIGKKFLQPVGNKITKGKEFLFGVPESKLMKDTAENASAKTLKKMASNTAENGGLIKQIVDLGKKALESIGKFAMEKFPKASGLASKLVKSADKIFSTLLKHVDDIMAKFSKKITATLTKIGAGTATGYTIDVVFGVGDLVTGFTAGNAGNLFGVSTENVDARMRTISSIMQTVFNFNFMAIITLINEITNMMFNYNFLRNIAIWLYNLTGGKQNLGSRITAEQIDKCTSIEQALKLMGITSEYELDFLRYIDGSGNYTWKDFRTVDNKELGGVISASEQMELARLQYNLENGTSLSSQAFIDKEAKTFGTKAMEWTKKIFTKDTAQQKYNKLTNKAEKKKAKAEEYKEKEKTSKTWLGKQYNKGMAWLNEKSAERAEKKAEKTKVKAEKKKAKAEIKANEHREKAETSNTWLGRKYHTWRANANEKKVERYTMVDDKVQPDENTSTGGSSSTTKEQVSIMDPKTVVAEYPDMKKGDVLEDGYGNKYDHTGKCIYNVNKMSGDAGEGEGEKQEQTKVSKPKTSVNKKPEEKKHLLSKITDNNKGGKLLKNAWNKGKEEAKEFVSNPLAYTINKSTDLANNTYEKFNKKVDMIQQGGKKVKDFAVDKINDVKNSKFVKNIKSEIKEKTAFINEGIDEDDSAGTQAAKMLKNVIKEINDKRKEMLNSIGDSVKKAMDSVGKAFKSVITETSKKIGEFKDKVVDGFKNGIDKVKTGFKTVTKNIGEGIGKKTEEMKTTFSKDNLKKTLDTKYKEIKDAWGNFTSSCGKIFTDLNKKFTDWKSTLSKLKLPKIKISDIGVKIDNAKDFVKDFFKELFNFGEGATDTKPLDQQIKPKNYVFKETDNQYKEKDAGKTVGGLKDRGNTHKFPFYAQADNRWGKEKLIGGKTIGESGCGPTASAMVLTKLTGQHITPDTMAKAGEGNLPGYTSYNYFPQIANKFKLNYSEIEANDIKTLRAKLSAGQPVILSGFDKSNSNTTPYTDKGHIVVATGMDGNNVQINDPRGPGYSGSYSLSNIMKGLKRGIVLSPTSATEQVGLPTSGLYSTNAEMTDTYVQNEDLPVEEGMTESLGGDTGQIKLWEKVVGYAKAFKEKLKYVYGSKAIDNNGMTTDCSGFTKHVMDRCGIKISAGSANQKNDGVGVDKSQAQAGDLVVWKGHVGLVVDSNKNMIDAGSGSVPKIRSYETDYWRSRGDYVIRRVLPNPNEMVSAKVDNAHTGIGFSGIVNSQGGGDLAGGASTSGTTGTSETVDELGLFGKMKNIGTNLMASIFNGKEVDMFATNESYNTGGTVDISGINDNAKAVYTFLTGKGYTPEAAAGILGNMEQESGVNPKAIQGGGKGPAAGIVQWENYNKKSARWKAMSDYAASKGKDWTDLQSQLEWMDLELQGKDSTTASLLKKKVGGYEQFKAIKDVNQAVKVFEESFERAGKPNWSRRYSAAQNYYNQFKNGAAVANEDAGRGYNMATSAETTSADSIPSTINGWAYYKQTDPKWQEDIDGKKIGPSGCGMASHAMMLTTMFNKQVTPVTVGKWARSNGYWSNGMSWSMPPAIANQLGLQIVSQETKDGGLGTSSLENLKQTVKSGYPAILSGRGQSSNLNTPFTTGGHIVLAVGVDGNGNLIINDPRGPQYTKAYTDEGVMNIGTGLRGYWAFNNSKNSNLPNEWSSGDYTATSNGTATGEASGESVDELGLFGKMKNIGSELLSNIYNGKDTTSGSGDGNTYLVSPPGDAGKGEKVSYTKSITSDMGTNTTDVNAQRNLDEINRKINVVMNSANSSDPNAYTEVLKLIVQELQAINNNTAATVNGINNIEIVSANTSIESDKEKTTADVYKNGKIPKQVSKLQTINQSTGYSTARQIAGYKKR